MQNTDLRSNFRRIIGTRQVIVLAIELVMVAILSVTTKSFFTFQNFMSIALSFAADGLIAIGLSFILISGNIDLSVGAMMGFAAMLAARLFRMGFSIWVSAGIAIVCAVCMGMILGLLIAKLNILPYIISLAMQSVARGAVYVLSGAAPISVSGDSVAAFKQLGGGAIMTSIGRIPVFAIIFVVLLIIAEILLKKTRFFAKVYFIGSNSAAAEFAGINVPRMKVILYMISAFFAAVAGILSLSRFGVATLDLGIGAESRAIMACVIGGTTMKGGEGGALAALLGLLLVSFMDNGLIQLGVNAYWQDFISALLLVLVVVFDYVNIKRKAQKV